MIHKRLYLIGTDVNVNLSIFHVLVNDWLVYYDIPYEYIGLKSNLMGECMDNLPFDQMEDYGIAVVVDLDNTARLFKSKNLDRSLATKLNNVLPIPVFGVGNQSLAEEVPASNLAEDLIKTLFKIFGMENKKLRLKFTEILNLTKFKKNDKIHESKQPSNSIIYDLPP